MHICQCEKSPLWWRSLARRGGAIISDEVAYWTPILVAYFGRHMQKNFEIIQKQLNIVQNLRNYKSSAIAFIYWLLQSF